MQEGPKLQTFYTCKDANNKCTNVATYWLSLSEEYITKCRLTDTELTAEFWETEFIKTPIDCPLLGKAQEYDVRFDKDVLMRNL
jgi:hypothetical protein